MICGKQSCAIIIRSDQPPRKWWHRDVWYSKRQMLSLKGKGVLVVGVRRIGGEVVKRLAEEGMNIAIAYRSSQAVAERLREAVAHKTQRVCVVRGDIAQEGDVIDMIGEAADQLGGLAFLVNLASDYERVPFQALDGAAWDRGMAAARGSYLLAVHAARHFFQNEGPTRGHILFCGDWAAKETPYPDYLPYLTGKAAIDFMTRAFAVELAPYGILVNNIAPGPTARPPDLSEEEWQQRAVGRAPLKRESSAAEIAELIVTLLKSETITGESIRVDAGRHLAGP